MPTPNDKIAQIEVALRRRFFALVPKIENADRNGWTEEQHDTDRLSRALAAFTLVGFANLDDGSAVAAITDGSNDGGIDALHFDRAGNRLIIVQAKFKRGGAAPSQVEVLKTINGVRALIARQFVTFNQAFQNKLDEIEEALDTAGLKICILFSFLGENLGQHATNDLNAVEIEMNRVSPMLHWEAVGLNRVYEYLRAQQAPNTIDINIALENWASVAAPRKAIYGQVSGTELAQLVQAHGTALFERNIRHYLGSIGVNTAIEETVRRKPGEFFYLNNGITAVAEQITQAPGNPQRCVFGLKKVSIVNGAQTAGSITTAALAGDISADAKLLITVIEIGAAGDDLGVKITRARNHQNEVRGVYFAALDPNQERLRQELAIVGIKYHYRPSVEARIRREDSFTLEEAAVALACLSFSVVHSRMQPRPAQNAIDYVVAAKKEIGRLWDQDGAVYKHIFPANLSGLHACRLVRIYRLVDRILAGSEQSEGAYYRRMFFRHSRYFVMAFVAHRLSDVVRRPQLAISADDARSISQQTNALAELIYARSVPQQAFKGYLSIFRNLTDSQPLANTVLDRLAEQDVVAQAVADAPPLLEAQAQPAIDTP